MFTARAFWITRRSAGLLSGIGPPAFTAIAMSLPMRANCFAIRSQRRNMVALRVSKMRPIPVLLDSRGFSVINFGEAIYNVVIRQTALGRASEDVTSRNRSDLHVNPISGH